MTDHIATLRVPNIVCMRWSSNPASRRPYVVEIHKDRIEHQRNGRTFQTTFTLGRVGMYATEDAANAAALRSGKRNGGIVQGMRGLLGLFPKPGKAKP